MLSRIQEIADSDREYLQTEIANFIEKPSGFICSSYHLLAVADYLKTKNPVLFKEHIHKAAEYFVKMYERHEEDESVSFSYLGDVAYKNLWDALASGDWQISKKLMEYVYKYNKDEKNSFPDGWGANTNLKKSKPLDRYFNYMFQITILDVKHDKNVFKEMREVFLKKHKSYAGYPVCFEAIYNKDNKAFETGFKEVMKGHRLLCRRGAEFGDTVDEIIAIWPLGLINLARMKGMDVSVDDELVPKDLLAEVAK